MLIHFQSSCLAFKYKNYKKIAIKFQIFSLTCLIEDKSLYTSW